MQLSKKPSWRKAMQLENLRRRDGIALISVLAVVTTATLVVLMFMTMARTEMVSSNHYAMGLRAQGLAESATNMVIAQIRQATDEPGTVWASQPGALRTFNESGDFSTGYKLFSDDAMQVLTARDLVDDLPAADWDTPQKSAHWVDLNAPLVRASETYYPIAHPDALDGGVEGFTYSAGAIAQGTGKLPMPVRWLYVLEDGTLGTLSDDYTFVAAPGFGGRKPTRKNPISGRIAFWTDDESCKINVNTASEPTPWDVPRSGGKEDVAFGKKQPAAREYQRFPGHPAMTALSPVLMPDANAGLPLTPMQKNVIYALVPRIALGGSNSGQRAVRGVIKNGAVKLDRDRLLPSIDELAFRANRADEAAVGQARKVANFEPEVPAGTPGYGKVDEGLVERTLRRSRFFLTTHSRAPEVNAFDMPRISIWPTSAEAETPLGKKRTAFDEMIRYCSTMGPSDDRYAYHFERSDSRSPTYDYEKIPRNAELYGYLQALTSRKVPGYGGTLHMKWEADRDQILTQVFDYIRCTNLYDDKLKPRNYNLKLYERALQPQFTEGRPGSGSLSSWPGHGQVVPIEIPSSSVGTRGFGRFYTISEAGILMICCGDAGGPKDANDPDAGPKYPLGVMKSNQPGSTMGKNKALPRKLSWEADKQERCVQAALLFELFCPAQGWTHINEDMTIEVEMVNPFTVDGERIKFHLDSDVWQSAGDAKIGGRRMGSVGEASYSTMAGGTVGFWTLFDDRYAPAREPLRADRGLKPRSSRERSDDNRRVYPFISEPFIVNGNDRTMTMGSAEIRVNIRLGTSHSPEKESLASRAIVQTLNLEFPQTTLPVPILAQDRIYSLEGGPVEQEDGE